MTSIAIRPGVVMAYEDHYFGPPWSTPETVVMIHGNSESSRAWTQWVPHLAGRYRVVRPDLPGFGGSTAPEDYGFSARELAADIGHFLDALGIRECHLIGAKYGGSACMQFGSEQPQRLLSLCLFGSPVRGSGSGNADAIRDKGVWRWATDTMRSRLGSTASEAQLRWWADELMGRTAQRSAFAASSARIDMTLEAGLDRITAPTLIVTTTESGLQSVKAVRRYAQNFPDAQVVVLPGDSYHIAAVEPETCARHALAFMAQASARRARRTADARAAE